MRLIPYSEINQEGLIIDPDQLEILNEWASEYPEIGDLLVFGREITIPMEDGRTLEYAGFLNTKIGVLFDRQCKPRHPNNAAEFDLVSMEDLQNLATQHRIIPLEANPVKLEEILFHQIQQFAKSDPLSLEVRDAFDFDRFAVEYWPEIVRETSTDSQDFEESRKAVERYDRWIEECKEERKKITASLNDACEKILSILDENRVTPIDVLRDSKQINSIKEIKIASVDLEHRVGDKNNRIIRDLQSRSETNRDTIRDIDREIDAYTDGISAGYHRSRLEEPYSSKKAETCIEKMRGGETVELKCIDAPQIWDNFGDTEKLRKMVKWRNSTKEYRKEFAESVGMKGLQEIHTLERGLTEGVRNCLGDVGTQAVGHFFLGWESEDDAPAIVAPYRNRYCEQQHGTAYSDISALMLDNEYEIVDVIHGTPGPLEEETKESLYGIGKMCEALIEAIDNPVEEDEQIKP